MALKVRRYDPGAMLEPCRSELNAFLQEERRLVEARQRLRPSRMTPSEKWLWERVIEMRTMRADVESPNAKRVIYRLSDWGRSARGKFTKPKVEVLAALGRDTGPISSRF